MKLKTTTIWGSTLLEVQIQRIHGEISEPFRFFQFEMAETTLKFMKHGFLSIPFSEDFPLKVQTGIEPLTQKSAAQLLNH